MSDIIDNSNSPDAPYRRLASHLHPDHGGSADQMRDLNALHDEVKEARKFQFGKNAEHQAEVRADVPDGEPTSTGDATPGYVPLILNGVEIPRGRAAELRAMPQAAYDQWLADRDACLRDPLQLSEVLGFDIGQATANPHRAMFDFMLGKIDPSRPFSELSMTSAAKRMLLWPRGTAKTFGVRVAEVNFILRYPSIRICFLTGGENLGKRQLASLKNVFKRPTTEFLRLFPEFCLISMQNKHGDWHDVAPSWGNAHEFNVPARGASIFPEPTFCISTARAVKAGSHFSLIIIDDLVNDSNWDSETLLEQSYQDYLDICPLLDPAGRMICTGTRYAAGDCYERIFNKAQEMAAAGIEAVWDFSIKDCWSTDCAHCKHPAIFHSSSGLLLPCTMAGCVCSAFASDGVKKCLFPVVRKRNGEPFGHTIEFLNKTLAEMEMPFFSGQYLNEPVVSSGPATFTKELIESVTVNYEQELPSQYISQRYMVLDAAYTEATAKNAAQRDETVLMMFLKSGGAHWIVGAVSGRWSAGQKIEQVCLALMSFRPDLLFTQKDMNSDSFEGYLRARASEFGLYKIPIQWTDATNKSGAKNIAIGNVENAMQCKRLRIFRKMQGYGKLVAQLLKFPNYGRLDHDDYADACAQVVAASETNYLLDPGPNQTKLMRGHEEGNPCSLPKSWLSDPVEDQSTDRNDGSSFCCALAVVPLSRRATARLSKINMSLHEASHCCAALSRGLRTSAEIRESVVPCGVAGGMSWSEGSSSILDDLFILSAGIAGSRYFQLGTDGCMQDFADINALDIDDSVKSLIQSDAGAFVAANAAKIIEMAFVLYRRGALSETVAQASHAGLKTINIPKSFLAAVQEITTFDWVLKE